MCHRGSGSHLPAQGSSGAGTCPLGSSIRLLVYDSSGGSACPRGSRPDEICRGDAEDLAEPGQCKATQIRSKQNRAQGAAVDSYRIDPDL
jgi:hypothetical protein